MGKALRIDCNVALDTRDLFACAIALAPQSLSGRANPIFNARSTPLIPSWSDSLHLEKYACTVRYLGNSLDRKRH